MWIYIKGLKTCIALILQIYFQDFLSRKESQHVESYSYKDVHHSVVYNGEKLEATHMFNTIGLVKQVIVVYLFWVMKYYDNIKCY